MKRYIAKLYTSDGSTFENVEAELLNYPTFSKSRNGGLGACTIRLNYGFGTLASKLSKIVKIYVINENNKTGKLIYTGVVSRQSEVLQTGLQYTEIELLGIQTLLQNAYYKNGGVYSVTHTTVDVSVILEAIVDHYQSITSDSLLSYTGASIDSVGTNVTYTFDQRKWLEAVNDAYDLAGSGWYWYINEAGVLHFHQNPTTATHNFTVGRDVEKIEVKRSIEEIINYNHLNYNGGTDSDSDATSITNYRLKEKYDDDQSITDATTAGEFTDKKVNDNKDPKTQTQLTINSNFDIESINTGDTCQILNIPFDSSVFSNNMTIERIEYKGEKAILYLDDYIYLYKEIKKLTT